MTPDLVFLGNLIVDDIVLPDGRTRMGQPGGAMLYATLGAALWGARVAVVAPIGEDYPRDMVAALEARGVDLSGLRPLGRRGLRTWLLYESKARRIIHQLDAATHAEASPRPEDISGALAGARAYHVAPIPIPCQQDLLEPLAANGAHVSLDPHDPMHEGTLDRWRHLLALVDLLFVSREEIDLPGIDSDPAPALGTLACGRLAGIALKRGAGGGTFYDVSTGRATAWPARAATVVDPTGAGDAFAGGFLTGRVSGLSLGECLARAAVSASFAIEDWGAAGLVNATAEEVRRRHDAWRAAYIG